MLSATARLSVKPEMYVIVLGKSQRHKKYPEMERMPDSHTWNLHYFSE